MTRFFSMMAAGAFAFSAGVLPALAQQEQSTTATVNSVQQPGTPSYAQILNAVPRTRSQIPAIMAMQGMLTNDVRLVPVGGVVAADQGASLDSAVSRNQGTLDALHRALGAKTLTATTDNSTLTIAQFLSDNRIELTRVVGAQVQGRTLILYIR